MILTIILMIVSTLIGGFAALIIKKGTLKLEISFWETIKVFKNHWIVSGGILYLISAIIYLLVLRKEDLTFLYPFASLTYVWVCLFSARFLKEKITFIRWLAVFLIVLGIVLISLGR